MYFFGPNATNTVVIPDGCESIGSKAFYSNFLTSIEIPASITSIAADVFESGWIPDDELTQTITIHKSKDSISGTPWGAENATINWVG